MMYGDYGHDGAGWGVFMALGMLLIAVLIGFTVVWLSRVNKGSTPQAPLTATGSAEQILAERMARGEIDPEEYQARLGALKSPR